MTIVRTNPYGNFNFVVDPGNGVTEAFDSVELPSGAIAVVEYLDGGEKESQPRRLPGHVDYRNVVLKRGVTGRTDLYDWWSAARFGSLSPRDVVITLLDEQGDAVMHWKLHHAWPVNLSWGPLDRLGDSALVEVLELTYDRFEVE